MFHNLFDSHTHSENSPDGVHSVIFMVEAAIEAGFQGIAITDHCDCELMEEFNYDVRIRNSVLDVARAKAAFHKQIIITAGIELGQPAEDRAVAKMILEQQPFDFVLLSLHKTLKGKDFYEIDYKQMSTQQIENMMRVYFEELLDIIAWADFDVLAHLTFPIRYPKLWEGIDINVMKFEQQITAILNVLVQREKGLEINTSGLRHGIDIMPPDWVVRRFYELGGKYITLGSDAHRAGDIGSGIHEGMRILKDAGFEQFAFYRDRKPVMLRII